MKLSLKIPYKKGSNPDTLKTKNFTLRNITTGIPDTLLSRFTSLNGGMNPVTEGFTVRVTNIESFGLNEARSGWFTGNTEAMNIHGFSFLLFKPHQKCLIMN